MWRPAPPRVPVAPRVPLAQRLEFTARGGGACGRMGHGPAQRPCGAAGGKGAPGRVLLRAPPRRRTLLRAFTGQIIVRRVCLLQRRLQ